MDLLENLKLKADNSLLLHQLKQNLSLCLEVSRNLTPDVFNNSIYGLINGVQCFLNQVTFLKLDSRLVLTMTHLHLHLMLQGLPQPFSFLNQPINIR